MKPSAAPVDEPSLLERLLALTHVVLQAPELDDALEAIARIVAEVFGFRYLTIVAADLPSGELHRRVLFGWPAEIVAQRLGEHVPREAIIAVLAPEFETLPHCFYIPAEHNVFWERSIYTGDLPHDAPRSDPQAWHERDTLAFVLPDPDGRMLGYLSLDGPLDGRIPSIATLRRMQLFVSLIGLALANARAHHAEVERRQFIEHDAQRQSEFFTMVSHEVRSPLAAIRGAAALLQGGDDTLLAERRAEILTLLASSAERLSRIFDDILLLSRVEGGGLQLHVRAVDTDAIIAESLGRARSEHPECRFERHTPETLPRVRADAGRVVQILCNLLSNAAKYSDPQTPIVLEVTREGDELQFRLSNQGPGIAPEDRAKLFTRFGRLGDKDDAVGLGLYISSQLVALMHGRIDCESLPNGQTTFWFTLGCADMPCDVSGIDASLVGLK
ncbi:MAG: sensor histidine kinase [Vulcanimicrobiaceae bacterium]